MRRKTGNKKMTPRQPARAEPRWVRIEADLGKEKAVTRYKIAAYPRMGWGDLLRTLDSASCDSTGGTILDT